MRAVRRLGLLTGLMIVALLPAALAVSPAGASAPDVAMSIVQPLATVPVVTSHGASSLLDSGILALVGTALMGIAALVRRSARN